MRPGPGLVVMALAFISGARQGTGLQSSSASQSGKLGIVGEDNTGEGGALSRINPWLSACDLEQPNSAPDLQVIYRTTTAKKKKENKTLKNLFQEQYRPGYTSHSSII
uniref:Uncharacterized protein n=1 Tax=Anopheles maculatus TaxID=74869 RepID=A0A182T201_9DIPT